MTTHGLGTIEDHYEQQEAEENLKRDLDLAVAEKAGLEIACASLREERDKLQSTMSEASEKIMRLQGQLQTTFVALRKLENALVAHQEFYPNDEQGREDFVHALMATYLDTIRTCYGSIVEQSKQPPDSEFFLDQDNSSHWYVIPASKHHEWWEWLKLDSEDEESWDAPEWVHRLNGGPCDVRFKEWRDGE